MTDRNNIKEIRIKIPEYKDNSETFIIPIDNSRKEEIEKLDKAHRDSLRYSEEKRWIEYLKKKNL